MTPHSEQNGARPRRVSRASVSLVLLPFALACVALVLAGRGRAAPRAAAAPAATDLRAVASFEGGQVTVADLDAAVANKAPPIRYRYGQAGGREALLHDMVDYALLIQEATRRGYADHPGVGAAMVLELANRITAQVAASIDAAALPEHELRAYYDANRARFSVPELRRASFVCLPTRQAAQELAADARRMPLDEFRTLAVRLDRSGKGSEIGYVDVDGRPGGNPKVARLDPVLVAKMFALREVGQLAEPFEHAGELCVLRLTARSQASGTTFESAAAAVRETVAEDRQIAALSTLVEELRKQHLGVLRPELADQVVLEPAKPSDVPAGFPAAPADPRAPTATVEPDGA